MVFSQELVRKRARQTLDDVDRATWPLMYLGVASYGAFGWREAVEALDQEGFADAEGKLFELLRRGYVTQWWGNPPFRPDLTTAFYMPSDGKTIADLAWPEGRNQEHTTFGFR